MRLPSPISSYRRWRHSRGFGIHSPFAYTFITDVLAQPLPYYGYADISADPRVRLLFRIAARFQPRHVLILSSKPQLLDAAVRRAFSKADTATAADPSRQPDLVVADDMDVSTDVYLPFIASGAKAVILNASAGTRRCLREGLLKGMLFDNSRGTLVAVPSNSLPRQNFDVRF